jgi:hypothetical protein
MNRWLSVLGTSSNMVMGPRLMECSFFNRMDFDALTMDIDMVIPVLKMVADYEMEGKVLILPMRGKGDCTLKFSKSQLTLK